MVYYFLHFFEILQSAIAASAQDVLASSNKSSLTELKNGFRVASVENNRPLTTVSVLVTKTKINVFINFRLEFGSMLVHVMKMVKIMVYHLLLNIFFTMYVVCIF